MCNIQQSKTSLFALLKSHFSMERRVETELPANRPSK